MKSHTDAFNWKAPQAHWVRSTAGGAESLGSRSTVHLYFQQLHRVAQQCSTSFKATLRAWVKLFSSARCQTALRALPWQMSKQYFLKEAAGVCVCVCVFCSKPLSPPKQKAMKEADNTTQDASHCRADCQQITMSSRAELLADAWPIYKHTRLCLIQRHWFPIFN